MIDPLTFLQRWFSAQIDGDWEHDDGIVIESLDNPGWYVTISLLGTAMEQVQVPRQPSGPSADDWVEWWTEGSKFLAACGPNNLAAALDAFREVVRIHDPVGYQQIAGS